MKALAHIYTRSPLRFTLLLFLTLSAIGLIMRPVLARQTPRELMQQGNLHWEAQSYGVAAEEYRKALAADPKLPERPELELRIAIALFRQKQWDSAVSAMESYVKAYHDTPWEARAQVWRARLYSLIDHNAYKVGKKLYRGANVPPSEGKEAPQRIELSNEDWARVLESFDRGKKLMERFRRAPLTVEERRSLTEDEIELNFDLVTTLRDVNDIGNFDTERVDWQLDLSQPFDPRWPAPKRVMFLYEQILALDAALPGGNHHATVLARLGQATYIMQLRQWGSWGYRQGRRNRPARPVYMSIPYTAIDPIQLLEAMLQRYPDDVEADRLAYTVALWTEGKGELLSAVSAYRAFLARYPKSRWGSDAQLHLDNLLRPMLSLAAPASTPPGKRLVVNLTTRNVSLVHFTAYRTHPETIYGHTEIKRDGKLLRPGFGDFPDIFGDPQVIAAYRKERVAEWTATTNNDGKHNIASVEVNTPLDSLGAYVIEAHAGDHDELSATTLAFVSDLTLVQKVDKDSVLVYTADSLTGKPIPNVSLTLWEPTHLYDGDYRRDALYATGATDTAGTFHAKLPAPIDDEKQVQTRRVCEVFAYAGNNRYAVTDEANFYTYDLPNGEHAFRAYIYTDRPLYRPNQEVRYRIVMTQGLPGRYRPAAGKAVTLTIAGPHGELLRKDITLGAYGSYNDTFPLPNGADLGDYTINAMTPKALQLSGGEFAYGSAAFRVEEYKKPEFEVSVAPEKSEVRVGERLKVTVAARYFFGAPVMNAKVHYKVFRTPYVHPLPFVSNHPWYNDENDQGRSRGDVDTDFWGDPNTAYREGDVTTNAQGEAKIEFATDPPKPPRGYKGDPGNDTDQNFTITAEVTDDSRRQVTGTGMARASALQFRAWMQAERHFLLLGDALKIEVRARDGGDKPFSADGKITVWRQIPEIPEQREKDPNTGKERVVVKYVPAREERESVLFVSTDAARDGAGLVYWHPEIAAEYRLEYTAKDAWGHEITAELNTLVYGPNYDTRLKKDDGRFELLPEYSEYRRGDTARLLLVTPKPDSYVLFAEQVVGSIQRYRTIFVPGRSTVITVPITGDHVPNALFVATLVRDAGVAEVQAQVSVPAEDRIFALTVTPDKAQYKPGEHATFKIHAVGADGRPIKGEVSLGVVDEALLALQPDNTPDIRAFFYGFQIQTYVAQGNSSQFAPGQITVSPAQPSYEQHPLLFPEGMGWLSDYRNGGNRGQIPGYVAYVAFDDRRAQKSKDVFLGGMPGGGGR
ncbi:MAG TPA: MG2 domain-containing protein, partial [Chthonomonadaceae bacterium]|nr:MG2 domain-containing protein [Chthonomonadaceae bacterium]